MHCKAYAMYYARQMYMGGQQGRTLEKCHDKHVCPLSSPWMQCPYTIVLQGLLYAARSIRPWLNAMKYIDIY